MTHGRYGGSEKRRAPRYSKRFLVKYEHEGESHEIRTIDICEHGILIPKRVPLPIDAKINLSLTIRDNTSIFEGIVRRHIKYVVNGVRTIGMGIEINTPEYQEFVKDRILVD